MKKFSTIYTPRKAKIRGVLSQFRFRRTDEMNRIAQKVIGEYESTPFDKLRELAENDDAVDTRSIDGYDVETECFFDDKGDTDDIRIMVSVNKDYSLLSFMFPTCRTTLIKENLRARGQGCD